MFFKHFRQPVAYERALAIQRHLVDRRIDGRLPKDVLLLLQHPPTYTVGRRLKNASTDEEQRLRSLGADFYRVQRGGEVTFHGPGQLVGYPIVHLREKDMSVRCFVHNLEESLIRVCRSAPYRIENADRSSANAGVWVQQEKIAAIGVQVSRYVTWHGFALNCTTDMRWFQQIVPCGLHGMGVTSLKGQCASDALQSAAACQVENVAPNLLEHFSKVFGNESIKPLHQLDAALDKHLDEMAQ